MRRIVRGLPVSTTSKPDLVPYDHRGELQIRMGEFKNANKYTKEMARSQCIMYLLGLLYWTRARLGKPVEVVYGFYLSGVRCGDEETTYTVGLIKLLSPTKLGKLFTAKFLTETASVDDFYPLRLLIHFLKKGKRRSVAKKQPIMEAHRRIPSLFALPTSLWTDVPGRNLVLHSTLSIVFQISSDCLQDLLLQKDHFKEPEFCHNENWRNFCDSVIALIGDKRIDDGTMY
mmetsp:Transcript_15200/g.28416  ORF Transcript_15200/g.28416 Transcript_15200/m.28416 type:complete len:230 (-) Transcript_15200:18-707(-)